MLKYCLLKRKAEIYTCKMYRFCFNGKNGFVEISKNLARYRSENNFV